MKAEEYIKTLTVNGVEVKLGANDCGQCYIAEYVDKEGNFHDICLGSFNVFYLEELYDILDEKYHELITKYFMGTLTEEDKQKLKEYEDMFEECYKNDIK